MNSIAKALLATCAIVVCASLMASSSWADQWNKKTVITINSSMQIPGKVLPPGKYVFKLMDSLSNRHIVQVFNEDETEIIATILAIPNYRLKPTSESEFGFWEARAGTPPPLRSWFYPGDNFGQEFAYPKREATLIAATAKEEVPTITEEEQAQLAQAPAPQPAPTEPPPVAAAPEPRAEPPVEQATIQEPARPAETPAVLPRTGSVFPLIGLFGLVSLGVAVALRLVRTLY